MIYEEQLITRWHDTDATLTVRPSQQLVYMQEMAFHHLNSVGRNLDRLRYEEHLAFILTRLTLNFYRPLHPMESIRAQTWISEGKGLNFPRYFRLINEQGEIAAEACSSWLLFDLRTQTPVRAGAFEYGFGAEPPLPFSTPRRLGVPDEMVEVGRRSILYSDIDYNGHMNNTRYPDMVCDYLPKECVGSIRTMHLEFAKEAAYGSSLRVLRGERRTEQGVAYLVQTKNEADEVCLAAEVLVDGPH